MKYHDPYDPEPTPQLEREQRLRLFQQVHQSPDEESIYLGALWRRSSGYTPCEYCQLPNREHPLFDEFFGWNEPVDRRLCSGEIVHL